MLGSVWMACYPCMVIAAHMVLVLSVCSTLFFPVCFLPGGGRTEECGAELDVPPPGFLPQPLSGSTPLPASLPHVPSLTLAVAPNLFQPSMQPELLPPKPAPKYSDAVRNLLDQGSEKPIVHKCPWHPLLCVWGLVLPGLRREARVEERTCQQS